MKIRLIEAKPPGLHVYSLVKLPRLGLIIIATTLRDAGHDVKVYIEDLAPIDWGDVLSSDFVGLSCTTSTAPQTYKYADRVRENGIPVIIGGPHATFQIEEALLHADYVARKESGELLMLELIEAMSAKRSFRDVLGLAYKDDHQNLINPLRPAPDCLDGIPIPDLTLVCGWERIRTVPILTSFGCPHGCIFCSVILMFGNEYRYFDIERVILELKEKRPKHVFFYDDNFGANKPRLKKLLQRIIEEDLNVSWSAQCATSIALKQKHIRNPETGLMETITLGPDTEMLELIEKSGGWLVYMGAESINPETLAAYHKPQSVQDIIDAVRYLNEYGIGTHGMFVLGADTDTKESIRATAAFAKKHHFYSVMFNILTPLVGTQLFDQFEKEDRIFDYDWAHYDALHTVYCPLQMTPYELQQEIIRAYASFYSLWRIPRILLSGKKLKSRMGLLIMGWKIVRDWKKDPANIAFLESLRCRIRPYEDGIEEDIQLLI